MAHGGLISTRDWLQRTYIISLITIAMPIRPSPEEEQGAGLGGGDRYPLMPGTLSLLPSEKYLESNK